MEDLLAELLMHLPMRALNALGQKKASGMAQGFIQLLFPEPGAADVALQRVQFHGDGGGSGRGELNYMNTPPLG